MLHCLTGRTRCDEVSYRAAAQQQTEQATAGWEELRSQAETKVKAQL